MKEKAVVIGPDIESEPDSPVSQLEPTKAELSKRIAALSKINEIALGIASVKSINGVYELVVDSALGIPGVRFVAIHQKEESGKYIVTPYFSFRDLTSPMTFSLLR